jgi:hypothetical protein
MWDINHDACRFYGTPCAVKMVDTSKDWELQRVLENEVEAYGKLPVYEVAWI